MSKFRIRNSLKLSFITYLGIGTVTEEDIIRKFGLSVEETVAFSRVIINSCLYMSEEKSNVRSCNSYVQLSDGSFVKIKQFLVDTNNSKEITLCNVIKQHLVVIITLYMLSMVLTQN